MENNPELKPTNNKLALIILEALRLAVSKLSLPKESEETKK